MNLKFKVLLYRIIFNLWPCIRGTGARVTEISPDFRYMKVKIPLNWRTRNRVGTIFGGSMYGAVDPFYMIMFMELLGKDFIVWDKGAEIKFIKPGKSTLHAEFKISSDFEAEIKSKVIEAGSYVFNILVQIKDEKNLVHAEVKKVMYAATKKHYQEKLAHSRGV